MKNPFSWIEDVDINFNCLMIIFKLTAGTDDDLPPSHHNRIQRGGSMMHGDMETQIHILEQEAYISVLRAFKAQADAISWVCHHFVSLN